MSDVDAGRRRISLSFADGCRAVARSDAPAAFVNRFINETKIIMAYNEKLADRVREHLAQFSELKIEEKRMFSGLAFLVSDKMCVNVSHDNLMCRFDPALQEEVAERAGYRPMIMKGKELTGYCYVEPDGINTKKKFDYWMKLCLDYNAMAKPSKKKTRAK